jgi:NADH-ubiquinone oxidoreductase chain 1
MLTGSLNLTVIIEAQRAIWFIIPLFPIFVIFFIGSIAETNRAPFDLAEAESELVSGFMTEHAAVIFVFFFLAEYASIVLICILTTILFLGGYLYDYLPLVRFFHYMQFIDINYYTGNLYEESVFSDPIIQGLVYGFTLGIKSCVMVFIFI